MDDKTPEEPVMRDYDMLTDAEKKLLDVLNDSGFLNSQRTPEAVRNYVTNLAQQGLLNVIYTPPDTPLTRACRSGPEALVVEMVKQGAPLSIAGWAGYPIDLANKQGMESAALEMIKRGASTDKAPDVHDDIHDMLGQFVDHCILPVYILEGGIKGNAEEDIADTKYQLASCISDYLFPLPGPPDDCTALHEGSRFAQDYFRGLRLSRTWHHPTIQFPHKLIPLRRKLEWHPLLPHDVALEDGLTLTCLTNTDMLRKESGQLSHCVGESDYDQKCCADNEENRSHILSIRNAHGDPLSTLEVMLVDEPDFGDICIGDTGKYLHVVQHKGKKDENPSPEVLRVWQECEAKIKSGDIILETDFHTLGETEKSKQSARYDKLTEQIGYQPSWEQASRCFDEFRRPERRATLDRPDSRKRVYDDITTEDGQVLQSHFIAGYALINADNSPTGEWALHREQLTPDEGQKIISLRSLSLKSWLRATGAMQKIQELAGKVPEVDTSPLVFTSTPDVTESMRRNMGVAEKGMQSPYFTDGAAPPQSPAPHR